MKKVVFLLISLSFVFLAACSNFVPIPSVTLSPTPAIVSLSPTPSLPPSLSQSPSPSPSSSVKEQNEKIAADANEAYKSGADYWDAVEPNIQNLDLNCVYWTPNGKSYHSTKDCVALLKSTHVISGTLDQAIAAGKTDPCSKCVGG